MYTEISKTSTSFTDYITSELKQSSTSSSDSSTQFRTTYSTELHNGDTIGSTTEHKLSMESTGVGTVDTWTPDSFSVGLEKSESTPLGPLTGRLDIF